MELVLNFFLAMGILVGACVLVAAGIYLFVKYMS